jgi:hypothetical protein
MDGTMDWCCKYSKKKSSIAPQKVLLTLAKSPTRHATDVVIIIIVIIIIIIDHHHHYHLI